MRARKTISPNNRDYPFNPPASSQAAGWLAWIYELLAGGCWQDIALMKLEKPEEHISSHTGAGPTHKLTPVLAVAHVGTLGSSRTRPEDRHLRMYILTAPRSTQQWLCDVGTLFPPLCLSFLSERLEKNEALGSFSVLGSRSQSHVCPWTLS